MMNKFTLLILSNLLALLAHSACPSNWSLVAIGPKSTCANTGVDFFVYTDSITTVLWGFGDGTYSNKQNITKAYLNDGNYPVTCTVSRSCGTDTVFTDTVSILNQPFFLDKKVLIQVSDSLCPFEDVIITTGGSHSQGLNFTWNLGGSIPVFSSANNADLFYETSGLYPVTANVTDACGNDTILYDTVLVSSNLQRELTYISVAPDTLCVGEAGSFYYIWNNNIQNIAWSFSNGYTDQDNVSTITSFDKEGKYHFSIDVTDNCGNNKVFTDSVVVGSSRSAQTTITLNLPDTICPNVDFPLNTRSSIKNLNWVISDGTNIYDSTGVVDHYFPQSGVYTVSVSGQDKCGNMYTSSKDIVVGNYIASMSSNINFEDTMCVGQEFIAAGGSSNYDCTWDFGDGTVLKGNVVAHAYQLQGLYHPTLTRMNSCGDKVVVTDSIIVKSDVTVKDNFILYQAPEVCFGDASSFLILDYGLDYFIDFGDGSNGSFTTDSVRYNEYDFTLKTGTVNHTYSAPGIYLVSVTAINSCGKKIVNEMTHRIKTRLKFPSNISISTTLDEVFSENGFWCANSPVDFSVFEGYKFTISYGDGNIEHVDGSLYDHVLHTYSKAGIYEVNVTGENSCGRKDTTVMYVNIKDSCPGPVSLIKMGEKIELKAYPIPSKDIVQFDLSMLNGSEIQAEIVSLEGKIINSFTTSENTFQYNFEPHGAGIYFVNVLSDEALVSKKVIIVK